jgi:hypothetical protein
MIREVATRKRALLGQVITPAPATRRRSIGVLLLPLAVPAGAVALGWAMAKMAQVWP